MANYPNRPRSSRNQNQAAPEQAVVESVLGMVVDLVRFIFKGGGGAKAPSANQQQVAQIREYWESVELHLMQEANTLAVSEADKLLDAALQAKRVRGETLGERLKAAKDHFPPDMYQSLWNAHKLRNTLAHEVGAAVNNSEAREAVGAIRTALYHLGILK